MRKQQCEVFDNGVTELIDLLSKVKSRCREELLQISAQIYATFAGGNKVLVCGNGGSAADSQHIAGEFLGSFGLGLKRPSLPVIALTVDTSTITAIANDFSYDLVFSRQIEGLGKSGDSLLVISTSGQSTNCLEAVKAARKKNMKVLSLTCWGSDLYQKSDYALGIPSTDTQRIQECHVFAYHIITEIVESNYFSQNKGSK